MVIWFRVLDKSGMEFIASVALSGSLKNSAPNFDQIFSLSDYHTLSLKSFRREDSGIYSCARLIGGNRLEFGEVTRLELEEGGLCFLKVVQFLHFSPTKLSYPFHSFL